MKLLLAIVQLIAILFIGLNVIVLFTGKHPGTTDIAFLVGWYIGKVFFFALGVSLMMLVRWMKKREAKRKVNALIDSLPY